jgi:chromosome transmission fidelity protein 18
MLTASQDTPLREKSAISCSPLLPPSSPSSLRMPALISSPIAYPPSSSPTTKRRRSTIPGPQKPRAIGGFLDDDSEDEDVADLLEPAPKRRMISGPNLAVVEAIRDTSSRENDSCGMKPGEMPRLGNARTIGGFVIDDEDNENGNESLNVAEKTSEPTQRSKPANIAHVKQPIALTASSFLFSGFADRIEVRMCSGKSTNVRPRQKEAPVSFEQLVAARSATKAGRAKKSYYGIDIHQLIDDAAKENLHQESRKSKASQAPLPSVEDPPRTRTRRTMMWTEKYRARRFFDLVGDDRTHREVLRWLKGWDPIVFPRSGRSKPNIKRPGIEGELEEKPHRKILLLNGPPGLGKTTLAHVCAVQAGYEVMEINASDERSSEVVKGRIRTAVGTESVKTVGTTVKDGKAQKLARPVCVVVDEVDGVVTGSGGSGEGGFIKALIDLVQLDAKNEVTSTSETTVYSRRKKKGDKFRLLRPLILICNDIYHPSLRHLRQSSFAEVIHIRKPPLEAVVKRMKSVFEKEEVACDNDGVRKLCEATWGMTSGPEARPDATGTGEGDLRSLLVVGEWVAGKLRSSTEAKPKLTQKWVEQNMLNDLSYGGGGARGVGRGGAKEIISRTFLIGAGFPKPTSDPLAALPTIKAKNDSTVLRTNLHASEIAKKAGMDRLREMVDTSGDIDRIVTDIFSVYPAQQFNDDTILSKPDAAYEWLHFHDICSSRVYSDQYWELMPYLSQTVLACHHLFASPARHYTPNFEQKKWNGEDAEIEAEKEVPFSGPRADYDAKEAEKSCRAMVLEIQSSLNATLLRSFRSAGDIATDLLPYLVRMLTPDVKPIIVGGSGDQRGIASVRKEGEREMVKRAINVMSGVGIKLERGKLEGDFGNRGSQWVYRMEPYVTACFSFDL